MPPYPAVLRQLGLKSNTDADSVVMAAATIASLNISVYITSVKIHWLPRALPMELSSPIAP